MHIPPEQCAGNEQQRRNGIEVINTEAKAKKLAEFLASFSGVVAIDSETVGVDPRKESPVGRGRIVCWSLSFRLDDEVFRYFIWWDVSAPLYPWLRGASPKVGHNIWTFDRHVFYNMGIDLGGIVGCTARMARVWRTDKRFSVGLKSLMLYLFGYELGSMDDLFSRPKPLKITTRDKISNSWRKMNGIKIPTMLGLEYQDFSLKMRELIPLDEIPTLYPSRLVNLYDYASLDAKACLELYEWLCVEMSGVV